MRTKQLGVMPCLAVPQKVVHSAVEFALFPVGVELALVGAVTGPVKTCVTRTKQLGVMPCSAVPQKWSTQQLSLPFFPCV